jgi:hypothetical protein
MKQILGFLLAVSGVTVATWAGATQWLTGSYSTAGDEYTLTASTGQTVLVRAYSTQTLNSQSGNFSSAALVNVFPGTEGFGVNNTLSGIDTGETVSPEWGVDNAQLWDVLVFELPSSGWTLDSLGLGWADLTTGTDISVFYGGNNLGAGYDFSKACFTGCTTSGTGVNAIGTLTSANMGFQQVNLDNVAVGTSFNPAGLDNPGRYLVVSGSLVTSVGDDKFKVNMIGASGGFTPSPAPGTLALLGLGLAGLIGYRRRAAQQA